MIAVSSAGGASAFPPSGTPIPREKITVLVLAGGVGSRLRAVTATPKPVIPVFGRPYLFYILEALKYQGLRRALVSVGYRSEVVIAEMTRWNPGFALSFCVETEPLGTGGALRRASAQIETDHVLVLNGDSFCDVPLDGLFAFHARHPGQVTMLATRVEDSSRYGRLAIGAGGRIASFEEKKEQAGLGWINAGIYLLPAWMLRNLADRVPLSLEKDVFPDWLQEGIFAHPAEAPFLDIGTPETYVQVEPFVAAMRRRRQEEAARTMFVPLAELRGRPEIRTGVGVLVLNSRNEVLLEKRSDCGLWGLPGGRIEPGETLEETARREVREEAGIDIEVQGLFGVYSHPSDRIIRYPDNGDMRHLIDIVVTARAREGEFRLSAESDAMCYFAADALPPASEIIPPARDPLRDFAAGKAGVLG